MDTSKKYIKMCDCKEIQKLHIPKEGDFWCCGCSSCKENIKNLWVISDYEIDYVNKRDLTNVDTLYAKMVTFSEMCFGGFWDTRNEESDSRGYIWFPRQDQLQDMVKNETVQIALLDFWNGVMALFDSREKYWLQFKSFEQLWLAFVMKEKFNKTWSNNKQEWIKQ